MDNASETGTGQAGGGSTPYLPVTRPYSVSIKPYVPYRLSYNPLPWSDRPDLRANAPGLAADELSLRAALAQRQGAQTPAGRNGSSSRSRVWGVAGLAWRARSQIRRVVISLWQGLGRLLGIRRSR